jgi:hypothetical protein
VIREEQKDAEEATSAQFQDLLFAHAYMNNNKSMYRKLYPEIGLTPEQEEELGWEIPQTEGEVQRMMAELAEVMPPSA